LQGGLTSPGSSSGAEVPELDYNPELVANDNGYGGRREYCRMEEKIVYADRCEPYTEQTCLTQNVENCQQVTHRNCTGTVNTKVERVCFTVNELICSLHQNVEYDTIQEEYHVQKCSVVKENVCDTTFDIQLTHKDDFKCCDVESEHCEDREFVINDVTCKNTFDFDCQKEARTDGSYGKETVCRKTPKNPCYETPRNVRKEICEQQVQRYCQKFTNPTPQPVERQNCHFEPKKVCQLEARTRNRKAKRYTYTPDCKPVPREICDQTEVNNVAPVCTMENRLDCDYIPVKKCTEEQKQYCWKVEQVVQEEVCDEKFDYENL